MVTRKMIGIACLLASVVLMAGCAGSRNTNQQDDEFTQELARARALAEHEAELERIALGRERARVDHEVGMSDLEIERIRNERRLEEERLVSPAIYTMPERIRNQLRNEPTFQARTNIPFVGISQPSVTPQTATNSAMYDARNAIAAFFEIAVEGVVTESEDQGSEGINPIADYFRRGAGRQIIDEVFSGGHVVGDPVHTPHSANNMTGYVIMAIATQDMLNALDRSGQEIDKLFPGRVRHENRMNEMERAIENHRRRTSGTSE
jgi:hypothetical protein